VSRPALPHPAKVRLRALGCLWHGTGCGQTQRRVEPPHVRRSVGEPWWQADKQIAAIHLIALGESKPRYHDAEETPLRLFDPFVALAIQVSAVVRKQQQIPIPD
jgi:hypothetical protein